MSKKTGSDSTNRRLILFRRLLTCKQCKYSLIGEVQKGNTYYRCHTKNCPRTCVREEVIEAELLKSLVPLQFNDKEIGYLRKKLGEIKENWGRQKENHLDSLALSLAQIRDRLSRLTDAFIDRHVDKETFEERKASLLLETKSLEEAINEVKRGHHGPEMLEEFLELARSAYILYKSAPLVDQKRSLIQKLTSNRLVDSKYVDIPLLSPFREVANRWHNSKGSPQRDIPRTWDGLISKLLEYFTHKLPSEGWPKKD